MGKPKPLPRLQIEVPLSRRGFQTLLRKAPTHSVYLKTLGVLGSSQESICQNLAKLLDRAWRVKVSTPRLTITKKTALVLHAVRLSSLHEAQKRKTISRIVFAIMSKNENALTRPTVQTLELFRRAAELKSEGASLRSISKTLSERGIKISRNSVARLLSNKQFLEIQKK